MWVCLGNLSLFLRLLVVGEARIVSFELQLEIQIHEDIFKFKYEEP